MAEEIFTQEGERVTKAVMFDAPPVETLAMQLGYPTLTANRIRAAREAVLQCRRARSDFSGCLM